ncbi:interleukin-6 receptor subunit beta [Antennarius striatus]|uniref:interleukin-6 receptor subunit beta n=1 Tax=Antennarius striatus TaxID=241820 RepID=UPI0035B09052
MMVCVRVPRLLVLACLVCALHAIENHLVIAPQFPVVEIGTNFTATCVIINTTEVSADDLYWKLSGNVVPKDQYTRINASALAVTVPIRGEELEWLFCSSKEVSDYVSVNNGKFIHGITLTKGYPPQKPENLTCMAVQVEGEIPPTLSCVWDPVGPQTPHVPTNYTLNVAMLRNKLRVVTTECKARVSLGQTFPYYVHLEVWVEAQNELGGIETEHLTEDADWFVKTSPPSKVNVISERTIPTSLLVNWTHPIPKVYLKLINEIRFCQNGSQGWTYVPLVDTANSMPPFRLQNLQPDTVYIVQVRCKHARPGYGYWSNWSTNTSKKTAEDQPKSKPDVWRIVAEGDDVNERYVLIVSKEPVRRNGKIKSFNIKVQSQKDKVKIGGWEWESVDVSGSEADRNTGQRRIYSLKEMHLSNDESAEVFVTAVNSVGTSPKASIIIPKRSHERLPVEDLKVWSHEGQLWVEWKPLDSKDVSEYVVEWVTDGQTDWQREDSSTRRTFIKGSLQKFVCYTVSVYPVYARRIGKSASMEAYLEQGAPLEGPVVKLDGRAERNRAKLLWKEIPQSKRRGFITNYIVFYTNGTKTHAVTVPANTTSYTLTSLSRNTRYDTWIRASTIRGYANGMNHTFITQKYAPGEIEGVVVGVSFGFLFVVLLFMLLCIYKRELIKENFWPRIPNPGESTIGTWSPDYPLKAEIPKENCLSGISVLDVDMCDGKSVFEEDKTCLPLKKDKYLSEEHSSGIGGSSCMSSPRQSVSDSDEGGDVADTTASTVQYSSVVASSGYKGQTPSCQPPQAVFSRSESTQPLLDSEENSDVLQQEGSRQSGRFLTPPCFTQNQDNADPTDHNQLETGQQDGLGALDFCPLKEDSEPKASTGSQSHDWTPAAPASSYMPQLGGYRPQ